MDIKLTSRNNDKLRELMVEEINKDENGEITSLKVNIMEAADNVIESGDPITQEDINKIQCKGDFIVIDVTDEEVPEAVGGATQIVSDENGDLWIVPPLNKGATFKLGSVKIAENTNGLVSGDDGLKMELATDTKPGSIQVTKGNGLELINGVISMNKATDTKAGSVQVTNENGLSINKGVISMNLATENNAGAMSAEQYQLLEGLRNDNQLNKEAVLNVNATIDCGVNLYENGYRKLRIEVYKEWSVLEEYSEYYFDNHGVCEVNLVDESVSVGDYITNRFSFLTGVTASKRCWIEGSVSGRYVYLHAYSSTWNSTTASNDSNEYKVKITVK